MTARCRDGSTKRGPPWPPNADQRTHRRARLKTLTEEPDRREGRKTMAELTISSDDIRGALERYVSSYAPEITRDEVGVVTDAGDGIAHVEGMPSTMANELLEFADGTLGVALNLDVREIGVVILGDF